MPTAAELRAYARRRAQEEGIDPTEIEAIGDRESSGFRPDIRDSPRGAVGPMQLIPSTAREMGVRNIRDPFENIDGGVRYYARLRRQFGDPVLAAAAYNAGPGAVQRHGGVPPYRETQAYVRGFPGQRGSADAQPAGQSSDDIFGFTDGGRQAAPSGGQPAVDSSDDIFGFGQPENPTPARQNRPPAPAGPQLVVTGPGGEAPASGHSTGSRQNGRMAGATASAPVGQPSASPQLAALMARFATDTASITDAARHPRSRGAPTGFAGAQATSGPQGVGPNGGMRTYVGRDGRPHQIWVGPGSQALAEARYGASSPYNNDARLPNMGPGGAAGGTTPHVPGEDLGSQIISNLGIGDELAGGAAYLMQGGRNVFRQLTGQPIEVAASDAYHAAANADRAGQRAFADEHPRTNDAATLGGILVAGAPRAGGAVGAALIPRGAPPGLRGAATGRTARAALTAGAASLPFTVANQPQSNLMERLPGALRDSAIAAGTAGLLHGAGEGLTATAGRTRAAPLTPQRQLVEADIPLTSGEILGGSAQRAEDALTSAPFAGNFVRQRQIEAVEGFNRSAWNRVLAPLGEELPHNVAVGRPALNHAEARISEAYTSALSPITVVPDAPFITDVSAVISRQRDARVADDLRTVINQTILPRFAGAGRTGPTPGQVWKEIDEELGGLIRAADASATNGTGGPQARYLRDALRDVQTAFRGTLQRQHPAAFDTVSAANEASANMVRLRDAMDAASTARRGGVVTPAQLNQAVERDAAGHSFARGDALMQDLTEPGMQVLPPTLPESGTAPRLAALVQPSLITGAAGAGVGVMADQPVVGAAAAGIPALIAIARAAKYSRPAQDAFRAAYRAASPANRAAMMEALSVAGQVGGRASASGAPPALRAIAEARQRDERQASQHRRR